MTQDVAVACLVALLVLLAAAVMLRSWRRRGRAQDGLFDTLPTVPAAPGDPVLGPLTGVYIGSTRAGRWQDRITRHPLGFRNAATLTAFDDGLRLEIAGTGVWIPDGDLLGIRQDSKLANKVVPGGGLLVLTWRVRGDDGVTEIDSGFRADDKDTYPRWTALRGEAAVPAPTLESSTADHCSTKEK